MISSHLPFPYPSDTEAGAQEKPSLSEGKGGGEGAFINDGKSGLQGKQLE
jgi:hypothetical protein